MGPHNGSDPVATTPQDPTRCAVGPGGAATPVPRLIRVSTPHPRPDVIVIGGGLIGSAIGWRLAQGGVRVTVVTGEPAAAASHVAAGMLAPVSETTFTEQALLPLNLASLRLYDRFAAELEQASDLPSGLHRTPTLSIGYDADDAARLRAFADFLGRIGHPCEVLTSREAKAYEPLLAPSVRSGLLVDDDWSCDNRLLWAAVREAGRRAGVAEQPGFVHAIRSDRGRVTGVETSDGSRLDAGTVVVANGAWAGQLTGIAALAVRPIKGQILRLDRGRLPGPKLTVRAFSRGTEVYLVPRGGGSRAGGRGHGRGPRLRRPPHRRWGVRTAPRRPDRAADHRRVRPDRDQRRLATRHAGQRAAARAR